MGISYKNVAEISNLSSQKGAHLTYKDLKTECVARGMPFDEVIGATFPYLTNWLLDNVLRPTDDKLVEDFDLHVEKILKARGSDYLVHNSLRLSYLKERDEDGVIIKKEPKAPREKKAPRERTETGLFKGTKKAYVQELYMKGKTLEQTMVKVCRKFPDAKEKSVKIWFNKFKKADKK